MLNLVLFGPPGAGKGTQSKLLMEKYNLVYISTGDILRKELEKPDSELGSKVRNIIDSGGLVHDGIIVQLIEEVIKDNKNAQGFLFDGFPRTYVQAYIFDGLLRRMNTKLSGLISLEVPEEELKKRLLERAKTSGRSDDVKDVIENRLKEYRKKTVPVINYYNDKGIFHPLDGTGKIEEVFERVSKAAEKVLSNNLLNVVIFGYPGSGKGTQAKIIAEKFGLVYISIGKILRDEISHDSEIGKAAMTYMEKGINVPDEIVIKVIENKIKMNPKAKGFVFKGFPRTIVQIYILGGLLQKLHSRITSYIELKVSPLESVRRLKARGETDNCRSYDKHTDSILQRLEEYEELTVPVLKYFRKNRNVRELEGKGSKEEIAEKLERILIDDFTKVKNN
ncbi:MAG: adenylate kinase [Candidatus Cloacimonadota bacterium]|nr:MAG: adenylate kinase [Candidatus Cloacimonadota bacterium]